MPNWTEQQLHVVGTKTDIDRFMRAGYTRRNKCETDNLLHFDVLCPPERRAEQREDPADSGVVLVHWRTQTQACFDMINAWDYPVDFYAALAVEWPTLSFACTIGAKWVTSAAWSCTSAEPTSIWWRTSTGTTIDVRTCGRAGRR